MSQRPPIQGIDGPGFGDGEVPGWDNVNGLFVPRGSVPTGGTTGQVLGKASDADFDLNWLTPSGGGGGGVGKDRRWNVGSAETSIDEFNDDSLDAAWVRVDKTGTTGYVTWAEGADALTVDTAVAGNDTTGDFHAMMRPLSGAGGSLVTGDAFITTIRLTDPGQNYVFGGLCLADGVAFGSGSQVMATCHWGSSSQQDVIRSYTNYSSATGGTVGNTFTSVALGVLRYIRLVYLGSNTWRRDYSSDGVGWILGSATLSFAVTPTYVGLLASSWGTSTKGVVTYEFLRRVSGIT